MKHEEFAYWLQGFAEISNSKRPSAKQWTAIVKQLNATFNKVTPDRTLVVPKPAAPKKEGMNGVTGMYCAPETYKYQSDYDFDSRRTTLVC